MKALYIVYYHPDRKAGLFYATHERIKHSLFYLTDYKILNFRYYDNWLLSFVKIIFGLTPTKKGAEFYLFDNLKYENIWLSRGLFDAVTTWGKLDRFRFAGILMNEFYISKKKLQPIAKVAQNNDYIMAHWGYPNGRIAMKISALTKKPFFVTYHGSDINIQPKINRIFKKRIADVLKNATSNIAVSEKLNKQVKKIDAKIETFVSTNGIPENIILKEKPNFENNSKPVSVIFIGNLIDVKRADKLPEIIKLIASKTNQKLNFTILGEGKYKAFIENDLKNNNISFQMPGLVPRSEVYDYLKKAKILMLPSRNEGMPLVILEAIATNTIPVASDIGGISEILEKDFLVNESSTFEKDFAKKVAALIKKPRYPKLKIENYTWKHLMKIENEILRDYIT
ncbi:MAG: glycosyltransferase [bacterium]